jgi:hypothetical protein
MNSPLFDFETWLKKLFGIVTDVGEMQRQTPTPTPEKVKSAPVEQHPPSQPAQSQPVPTNTAKQQQRPAHSPTAIRSNREVLLE